MKSNDVFSHIENIFNLTLKVNVHNFHYPYSSIHEHDHGFRRMLWCDFDYLKGNSEGIIGSSKQSIKDFEPNHIAIIKSKLKFINILYRFPADFSDDLIIIGPFLQEAVNEHFLHEIIKENRLTNNVYQLINGYYQSIPVADESSISLALQSLLEILLPDYALPSLEYVDYTSKPIDKIEPHQDTIHSHRLEIVEDYVHLQKKLFSTIVKANYHDTEKILPKYLKMTNITKNAQLSELKKSLFIFNAQLETILLSDKVHPAYIKRVSHELDTAIQNETQRIKLIKLPYTIAKKYCRLVKNYAFSDYSLDVRKAISYIDLNIDRPVALADICNYLNKNASTFSNQFKRETGETVTNFIRRQKMKEAMNLLETTELSVNEVASMIGIYDFSYFCKIFKKVVDLTPSEYRSKVHK